MTKRQKELLGLSTKKYAPKILKEIRKRLDWMAADPEMLPKLDRYNAVHYMLNEWEAIENIFTRGDYHLDNNLVERLNRYPYSMQGVKEDTLTQKLHNMVIMP